LTDPLGELTAALRQTPSWIRGNIKEGEGTGLERDERVQEKEWKGNERRKKG